MKKIICFVLSFVLTFCCLGMVTVKAASTYYKTACTATYNEIELSKNTLNSAKKNCINLGSSINNSATISKAYECHVYHFEAPTQGYYAFYTMGSTDTIIKVYEHQNFLWWTTNYKDRGLNDDGCLVDKRTNACLILECAAGEDFYICVRAYNKRTGNYTLVAEANQDKMSLTYNNYSKWTISSLCNGHALSGTYTYQKSYLNTNEVVLYYWALNSSGVVTDENGKEYRVENICTLNKESVQSAISYASTIVGLLLTKAPSSIGLTATFISIFVDFWYDNTHKSRSEMSDILHNVCGADRQDLSTSYVSGEVYTYSRWYANSGLCISDTFYTTYMNTGYDSYPITMSYRSYDAYNSTIRVGYTYDKGVWSK